MREDVRPHLRPISLIKKWRVAFLQHAIFASYDQVASNSPDSVPTVMV